MQDAYQRMDDPYQAPDPYLQAQYAPMRKPKRNGWDDTLDKLQDGLNIAGFLPGVGSVADLGNAGISLLRGRPGEAAMNALFAIPGLGDVAALPKAAKTVGRIAGRIFG